MKKIFKLYRINPGKKADLLKCFDNHQDAEDELTRLKSTGQNGFIWEE